MTPQTLALATGATLLRAQDWLAPIEEAMAEFDISTPRRKAAFLAQVGHESGGLHWVREIWGDMSWQRNYEGRADLGNTQPGDGKRFMGRGLLQITGRYNYGKVGAALGLDLLAHPELLEEPAAAARSAALFWKTHRLNELADEGKFETVTRVINGELNGYEDRLARYTAALKVLV
jgi:putative chitinase